MKKRNTVFPRQGIQNEQTGFKISRKVIAGILISSILVGALATAALFTWQPSRSPSSLMEVDTTPADQLLLQNLHSFSDDAFLYIGTALRLDDSQSAAYTLTPVNRYFLPEKKRQDNAPFNYYAVLYRQTFSPYDIGDQQDKDPYSLYYLAAATNIEIRGGRIIAMDSSAQIYPFDSMESATGTWLSKKNQNYREETLSVNPSDFTAIEYRESLTKFSRRDGQNTGSASILAAGLPTTSVTATASSGVPGYSAYRGAISRWIHHEPLLVTPERDNKTNPHMYNSSAGYALTLPDTWLGQAIFIENNNSLSVYCRPVYEAHLLKDKNLFDGLLFTLILMDQQMYESNYAAGSIPLTKAAEYNGQVVVCLKADGDMMDNPSKEIYLNMQSDIDAVVQTLSFCQDSPSPSNDELGKQDSIPDSDGEPFLGTVRSKDINLDVSGISYPLKSRYTFDAVNQERARQGLSPLSWDDDLAREAAQRALEISVDWSHTRPDTTKWYTISNDVSGENIAKGNGNSALVVQGWLNSVGHCENLLRQEFLRSAVACIERDQQFYWVQLFGS